MISLTRVPPLPPASAEASFEGDDDALFLCPDRDSEGFVPSGR